MSRKTQPLQGYLTLTGASGSGKDFIRCKLAETGLFGIVKGFCTRDPRPGETPGENVNFVSKDYVQALIDSKSPELIEHVEYQGNYYGIRKQDLEAVTDQDKFPVSILTPEGVQVISGWCNENGVHHLPILLAVDEKVLVKRFLTRTFSVKFVDANLDYDVKRLLTMLNEEVKWGETHSGFVEVNNSNDDDYLQIIDLAIGWAKALK